jgi:predicted transcriptional regulator
LPVQLSGSAVRAMLKRLEDKGFVRRSESERGFLYSPVVSDTVAKKSALTDIVRVFFNGSPASAASALLGMSDKLKEDEIDELERMIARARKSKGDQ